MVNMLWILVAVIPVVQSIVEHQITKEICDGSVYSVENDYPDGLTMIDEMVLHFSAKDFTEDQECMIWVDSNSLQSGVRIKRLQSDNVPCDWVFVYQVTHDYADLCDTAVVDFGPRFAITFGQPIPSVDSGAAVSISLTPFHLAHNCTGGGLCCDIKGYPGLDNEHFHICDMNICLDEKVMCDGVESCVDATDEGEACCGREGYGACEVVAGVGGRWGVGWGVWGVVVVGMVGGELYRW